MGVRRQDDGHYQPLKSGGDSVVTYHLFFTTGGQIFIAVHQVFATENDVLNGIGMLFIKLLTNRTQMFAEVRKCFLQGCKRSLENKKMVARAGIDMSEANVREHRRPQVEKRKATHNIVSIPFLPIRQKILAKRKFLTGKLVCRSQEVLFAGMQTIIGK